MSEFKVGDKVEVVDPSGDYRFSTEDVGKTFVVERVTKIYNTDSLVKVFGKEGDMFASRFKKVDVSNKDEPAYVVVAEEYVRYTYEEAKKEAEKMARDYDRNFVIYKAVSTVRMVPEVKDF